jgi:hypothetical protein
MKWCHYSFCRGAIITGFSAIWVLGQAGMAAPPAQTAAPVAVVRSVFIIPASPSEGRDPFYPNSKRPYERTQVVQVHVVDVSSLVLKGISGTAEQPLAIINNRTFGVGDEQDIVTPQGRIHVRCVEVKTNSVVIETSGENHELKYTASP